MNVKIQTVQSAAVDLLHPEPEDYQITDIAGSLSKLCRFVGQIRTFYSVAQHSVECARQLRIAGHDRKTICWGLLHDAAESLLGDVSSPLKQILPRYAELEGRHDRAIAGRFGLPWPIPYVVKDVDRRMLITERNQFFTLITKVWDDWRSIKPYDIRLDPLPPAEAEKRFLDCADELGLRLRVVCPDDEC